MTLTEQQFRQMMPHAGARLDAHWPFINPALEAAKIDTPERIAAFLAQLAHESAEYRYMEEIADGSAYEGRTDLGNVHPGDGVKFKGHGPIQITGRANHDACGRAMGLDLLGDPTLLTRPEHGTRSACWFWTTGNRKIDLNLLADRAWFRVITRIINGGTNGWADRLAYYLRNRQILKLPPYSAIEEDAAIRAFQRERGLVDDGIAGTATLAAVREAA